MVAAVDSAHPGIGVEHRDLPRNLGRRHQVVVVEEVDVVSRGHPQALAPRGFYALVALLYVEETATVASGHLLGRVRRAVVYDYQLEVRIGLRQHAVDRGGEDGGTVVSGDDDRHQRRRGRHLTRLVTVRVSSAHEGSGFARSPASPTRPLQRTAGSRAAIAASDRRAFEKPWRIVCFSSQGKRAGR